MEKKKQSYHHGDLYLTLVATAKSMLLESGLEALSMRKLAENAGVSRTAPYHHFKDKNALLCAIAEDGFLQQDDMLDAAFKNSSDLAMVEKFEHLVLAYLRFGTQNPQQYDLMYGGGIWKLENNNTTDSLVLASKSSFKHWLAEVEKLQQQGYFQKDIELHRLAQATWATLHGLCRLWNDGIYTDFEKNIEEMAATVVKILLNVE